MSIKFRLILMNFLQFFVWGSWLISIGGYLGGTLHFTGAQIGAVFSTLGIASLFMPALMGIVADKWLNAERVLGICHIIGAGMLIWASTITDPSMFFWVMLLNSMFYMPTIALNNTVSYIVLEQKGFDIVKDFPPIRVWGTIGFIAAMWIVDLFGWTSNANQLLFSAGAALVLGLYSFAMPPCPPVKSQKEKSFLTSLGLDAFVLFKQRKMFIFFLFACIVEGQRISLSNYVFHLLGHHTFLLILRFAIIFHLLSIAVKVDLYFFQSCNGCIVFSTDINNFYFCSAPGHRFHIHAFFATLLIHG